MIEALHAVAQDAVAGNGQPVWVNMLGFFGILAGLIVIVAMNWRLMAKPVRAWRESKAADRAARESDVDEEKRDL